MIYKQKLFCFVSATNTNEKFIKIQISMTMRTFAIQVELFISVLLILIRGGKKKKVSLMKYAKISYFVVWAVESDLEKIMSHAGFFFQVVLYNNYIVLYYLTWFARFIFSQNDVCGTGLWFCNNNFHSIREKTNLAIHVK